MVSTKGGGDSKGAAQKAAAMKHTKKMTAATNQINFRAKQKAERRIGSQYSEDCKGANKQQDMTNKQAQQQQTTAAAAANNTANNTADNTADNTAVHTAAHTAAHTSDEPIR